MNNQKIISDVINRFRNKWLGKPLDYDNAYASQCVDVIKQYFEDLGIKETPTGDAWQYIDHRLLKKYFTKIVDRDEIKRGDIFIIDRLLSAQGSGIPNLEYGHIGLCDAGKGAEKFGYNSKAMTKNYPPPRADEEYVSHIWILDQNSDGKSFTNSKDPKDWSVVKSRKLSVSQIAQVWRPDMAKIRAANKPKKIPVREIEQVETSGVIVDDDSIRTTGVAHMQNLDGSPIEPMHTNWQEAVIDKADNVVVDTSEIEVPVELLTDNKEKQEKVKNIKLKQRLVKEKQAQVAEMKDSDAKRVSKQTKRNSGYIGAALWSIWSFFDDRVEFLMTIEDLIGHDTLMNLILLVLPVFIYDALNKYAFSRFKQQGKINMLLMPLLIGVGDAGYRDRKSKAMADITELENEITADLGKLVADKVLR